MSETPATIGQKWANAMAAQGKVVGASRDLPSAAAVAYLEDQEVLVRVLDGAAWLLRNPQKTSEEGSVLGAYWPVVAEILKTYAPAAIDRVAAIRLMLGEATPPDMLHVRQGKNASKRQYTLPGGLQIRILPFESGTSDASSGLDGSEVRSVSVGGTTVSVMSPARVLLAIPLGELRDAMPVVSAWLRHLSLPIEQVEAAYRAHPRPYVAARIAKLAEELGNQALALTVAKVIRAHSVRPLIAARVQVPATSVSTGIRQAPAHQPPWRTRLVDQLERGLDQLSRLPMPSSPAFTANELRAFARVAKREDVYHSTTIEGYRVTPEDLKALFDGNLTTSGTPEERERRLALLGYSNAFDKILEQFPERPAPMALTADRIRACYADLWRPSVDAGIIDLPDLWSFRNRPAYLSGSRYVPPAPEKIWDLLETLGVFLNDRPMSGAVRAALGHWGFETVHPFVDGNGRVGRLLMNASLCAEGYPWMTIRAEDRDRYFRALERAQVDEDFNHWGTFFLEQMERTVSAALRWRSERRAAPSAPPAR